MSHHFFLSYSRADSSPLLKRFFDDLSDSIRIELNLPYSHSVGFYEETRYGLTSDWSDAAKEALQDSGMMVCLLSPAYLHCERAGKEWQIFDMRRQGVSATPESLAHIILPVTWSQWDGPIPKVVNEILAHPDHIHQRRGLTTMFRLSGMFQREYAEFVKNLANQIIEMASVVSRIGPLNSLPKMSEVHSAFHLWDEAAIGSDKTRNRSKMNENACWHAEFVKGAQRKERAAANSETGDASSANQQKQSESTATKTIQRNYLVFAISKESQMLDLIEDVCLRTPFHVKRYEDTEKALSDVRSNPRRVPDLFVVDLDNAPSGPDVIETLKKRKLLSTILAVSGDFEGYTLPKLVGTTAIVPNLFRSDELMDLIKQCAKIGRDRHVYRKKRVRDQSRTKRPVFLSYCSENRGPATFLSSNLGARTIEVWTMDETLNPGDVWNTEIRNEITRTQIFIPLITNSYLKSEHCMKELTDFYKRLIAEQGNEQPPLLIPVLYDTPDTSGNEFIERDVKGYNAVKMSDTDFLEGFNSMMGIIQDLLRDDDDDPEM